MAQFKGCGNVKAELSNGEVIECETHLIASGDYREWFEPAPVEYMYGWTESEYEIDEGTIEPENPEDFVGKDEYSEDVKIVSIVELLDDIEWDVQNGWNKQDQDEAYKSWKEEQIA